MIELGFYKEVVYILEIEIENLMFKEIIPNEETKIKVKKLIKDLYFVYSQIDENYKKIDLDIVLKKLNLD